MSYLDELMAAGEGLGLERRATNPTNQPMTNTTSSASIKAWNPTIRERFVNWMRGDRPSPERARMAEGIATLSDFTPAGIGYALQDMSRAEPGSMGMAAAAVGAIPGTRAAAPALRRSEALMDLAAKYARPQAGQTGLKTGYSGVKHERPFEEMTRTVVDDPTNVITPAREADLASMVGGYMIPLVGDRTEAGKILTEINGTPLYHGGTRLEGGFQYGQSQASRGPDRSGWASHYEPISTLHNRLQKAHMIADGRPVYGMFSGMGERAGDFSTMNADALMGLVPASGMSGGQMAAFDEILRKRLEKDAGKQGPAFWPGLENLSGSRDALLSRSGGELRKAFVETADSAAARSLGMPDVAAVRKATTHPDLLDWQGAGASGGSIVRFDENGLPVRNPSIPHGTYPSQYPGTYIGQTRTTLDRNEAFPRTTVEQFSLPRSTGDARTWANVDRAFMTNAGLLEKLDQEWLDTIMASQERRLANGR